MSDASEPQTTDDERQRGDEHTRGRACGRLGERSLLALFVRHSSFVVVARRSGYWSRTSAALASFVCFVWGPRPVAVADPAWRRRHRGRVCARRRRLRRRAVTTAAHVCRCCAPVVPDNAGVDPDNAGAITTVEHHVCRCCAPDATPERVALGASIDAPADLVVARARRQRPAACEVNITGGGTKKKPDYSQREAAKTLKDGNEKARRLLETYKNKTFFEGGECGRRWSVIDCKYEDVDDNDQWRHYIYARPEGGGKDDDQR